MSYGMDYQGGGGGGGFGGGGGGFGGGGGGGFSQGGGRPSSSGGGARRSYDEQSMRAITISMALHAKAGGGDSSGSLQLADGRPIHHVKIVGAIRSVEDFSTNAVYQVEDGTGLLEVKQWLDNAECTYQSEMRAKCMKEHIYVRVIGQIKDYDGKKMLVADSVRPIVSGNELSHHMLEVVYAAENFKRKDLYVAPQPHLASGVGFAGAPKPVGFAGAPLAASTTSGGDDVQAAVADYLRREGDAQEIGASVVDCIRAFAGRYSEGAIRKVVEDLSTEGHLYSTVDDDHYKFAM